MRVQSESESDSEPPRPESCTGPGRSLKTPSRMLSSLPGQPRPGRGLAGRAVRRSSDTGRPALLNTVTRWHPGRRRVTPRLRLAQWHQ